MTTEPIFAELTSRALVAVGGPDWRGFLNNLLTQNVETLAPGEPRFAALLTPQGRLLYDMFVVGRPDGAWLDVGREHREALVQKLTLHRLRAKVTIAAHEGAVWAAYNPPPQGEVAELSAKLAEGAFFFSDFPTVGRAPSPRRGPGSSCAGCCG